MSEEKAKHNPQKKVWEDMGIFNTYEDAKVKSDTLERESKIRRCGALGSKFKVKAVVKYINTKES